MAQDTSLTESVRDSSIALPRTLSKAPASSPRLLPTQSLPSTKTAPFFLLIALPEKSSVTPTEEMLGAKLTILMPEYLRHLHRAGLKNYVETGT